MSRAFNVAVVAHALDVNPKWLDNLLTNNDIAGARKTRQGIPRQLTHQAVATIFIARHLMNALGATAELALRAAQSVVRDGAIELAIGVRLHVDVVALNDVLSQRLLEAVQTAPAKPRGRPRIRRFPDKREETRENTT